ncbi:M56 family metallopeptidase [Cohnella nanjingensis]|uniref:DUF4825 domain-containing protein n=1 Tax=Cohnella nanjingensis TaxID=1387779 RepID=A0A7X0VEM7_9BACL|nr:M56 family metallopeptidase [Cohnella nanjingensis]MBB6670418.1 DUF4825 domain-containing protein [Cohnella nanjingensis]
MNGLSALFATVLNMSITASYVAVGVFAVRFLLRRAPKIYSYALWSAVLVRMAVPITLTSAFSLLGFLPAGSRDDAGRLAYVPPSIGLMPRPEVSTGIPAVDRTVNASLPEAVAANSVNPMQLVMTAAGIVWISGTILLLAYSLYTYLRTASRVRTATRVRDRVYETDRIASPFVFGLLRPKIYVPVGLEEIELRYIAAHEETHIRRRDHWIKPLAYLALIVHWFNPLLWLSFRSMSKDMEMACDERVLRSLGPDGRHGYSQSLLSLSTGKRDWLQAGPLTFGEDHVTARIKRIVRYRRPGPRAVALVFLAVAALIAGFVADPRSPADRGQASPPSDGAGEVYPVQELLRHQTAYVGDNSRVVALIDLLPLPSGYRRGVVELHTAEAPYGLTIRYEADAKTGEGAAVDQSLDSGSQDTLFRRNAAVLFSLIGNVDRISAVVGEDRGHPYTVERAEIEAAFGGDVRPHAADETKLSAYVEEVARSAGAAGEPNPAPPAGNEIVLLSSSRVDLANGGILYVNVEMVEGRHETEAEAGGPGGGIYADNYTGTYRLRVVNPALSTQGSTAFIYDGLMEDFGEKTLNFGGKFDLAWADYNGDGQPDFTLGQWAGSNGGIYRLYTLTERGEIVKLDTGGEMYIADHLPSVLLEQLGGNRFAAKYYDQESGEYKQWIYQWDKDKFAQVNA